MKYIRSFLLLTFIFGSTMIDRVEARDTRQIPSNIAELKLAIEDIMQHYQVPALGIAMLDENGPIWIEALGVSNTKHQTRVETNSLFRIGSTSKMIVALAVLKLSEKGQLDLTANLKSLAPEIEFHNPWEATHPIRLIHLLEHTTGWDEQHYPEFAHNQSPPISLKEGLDFHPHSRHSRWVPGSRYAYNNTGPNVAAYIVEKISGQKFEDFVQTEILDLLAMTDTTYYNDDKFKSLGTTGYNNEGEPQSYHNFIGRPSAALNSSITDMAKLLTLFIKRGKSDNRRVLSESAMRGMERPQSSLAAQLGVVTGYGLANYSSAHGSWVYRQHDGGVEGFMSSLSYLPNERVGHVILANTKNISAFQKLSKLIKDYETQKLNTSNVPERSKNTISGIIDQNKSQHKISAEDKLNIEGLYYPINPRVQLFSFVNYITNMKTFYFNNDELVQGKAIGSSKNYYTALSENLYVSNETGLASIARVTDPLEGEVLHYAYGDSSRQNFVLKKINPWLGYGQLFIVISWLAIILISIINTVILGIKKLRGTKTTKEMMKLQKWPLLTSWSFIAIWMLLNIASERPYSTMSEPTFVSVSVMLLTIVFAVFSVISVLRIYEHRRLQVKRSTYWYNAFSSTVHLLVAFLLYKFGVIGIIFWA